MLERNEIKHLNRSLVPSPSAAVEMHISNGGHITMESNFGIDPLHNDPIKCQIRLQSLHQVCPPFDVVFSGTVNGNKALFRDNLLHFINITKRLAIT